MVIIFQGGEFYEKGPKGQELVSIFEVNGRISTELVELGVSRDDAGRILANLKPEEKAQALNDRDYLKLIAS